MMTSDRDRKWMQKALYSAERGRLTVSPNPMVGACIVKGGKPIASGFHRYAGGDHAEVYALKAAGPRAQGASLYITLEPCSTWGKTPPCTDAIIKAGVREVIIGAIDPNPKHLGRGIRILKKKGLKVREGVFKREVTAQNESFMKWTATGMPFVTLKMAQTLDGKIATKNGSSRWITSSPARQMVHRMRNETDAVLVGKNTLYCDNPKLSPGSASLKERRHKPWRFVLDPEFKVSSRARIFEGPQLTFVIISEKKAKYILRKRHRLSDKCSFMVVAEKKGKLDMRDALRQMGALGVGKLLVEGGGELAWSLLEQGLIDRGVWMIAPKIIGGREAKTSVEGAGFSSLDHAILGEIEQSYSLGPDWVMITRFPKGNRSAKKKR